MSTLSQIAHAHRIRLMILFGSQATANQTDHSDFDIAVEFERNTTEPDILALIADLEQIYQGPVDLTIASMTTNPLLLHEIASGRLLFESKPEIFTDFQCRAWKEYIDSKVARAQQFRWLKEFV
jgi:predicted nucleotidyltransferase